jgi:hypothetical protein
MMEQTSLVLALHRVKVVVLLWYGENGSSINKALTEFNLAFIWAFD